MALMLGLNQDVTRDPIRVLLDDIAWPYRDKKTHRRDNPNQKVKAGAGVQRRYSNGTITPERIVDMGPDVKRVIADDCYLFRWATGPHLMLAGQLMPAWGFEYVNPGFVWIKTYRVKGSYFQGLGSYTWSNAEFCLLGTRPGAEMWHVNEGWKPNQVFKSETIEFDVNTEADIFHLFELLGGPAEFSLDTGGCEVIECPHPVDEKGQKIHSRKPEEIQERISRWLDPYGPHKAELFATRQLPGWTCLGHELSGRDITEDLAALQIDEGKKLMRPAYTNKIPVRKPPPDPDFFKAPEVIAMEKGAEYYPDLETKLKDRDRYMAPEVKGSDLDTPDHF